MDAFFAGAGELHGWFRVSGWGIQRLRIRVGTLASLGCRVSGLGLVGFFFFLIESLGLRFSVEGHFGLLGFTGLEIEGFVVGGSFLEIGLLSEYGDVAYGLPRRLSGVRCEKPLKSDVNIQAQAQANGEL